MTSEIKSDIIESLQPLPYAREVQAWLINFLSKATGKIKPSEDLISNRGRRSGMFVDFLDIDQALGFISVIYKEQGYMPPWELEDRLIKAYNPKLPPAALNIASEFSVSEQSRDPLTNYYQKPHTPLIMGLSAFYRQTQNHPVSVFEIDFSNMRGTNEHNERVLRTAYSSMEEREVRDLAMSLTDQYVFLVSGAILKSLEERINRNQDLPVRLIPLRTGGDEVRIVAVNMSDKEAARILPAIHDAIEATTASLGLHDHPHTKRPLDNLSNGFGAAGTIFKLEADGQFYDAIAHADKEIGNTKVEIGRLRAESSPFAALKPENFDIQAVYSDPKAASRYLDHLHETIIRLDQELNIDTVPLPGLQTVESIVHERRPDHIPSKDELQGMIFNSFLEKLRLKSIQLTPDQEKVLRIKVLKFPQDDPSSGALLGRDFPAIAGMALQVVHDINEKEGHSASLWTMGVSFHNLAGLNETLGHGHSNLVLRYQAAILRESMNKVGLSEKNCQIAHMGNGDFQAVIQPVIVNEDGSIRTVTQHVMEKLSLEIEMRVKKLNEVSIKSFLQRYTVNAPDDLNRPFGTLENPRDVHTPGLRVSVSVKPYEADPTINTHHYRQGGAVSRFISDQLADTATANKRRWSREVIQRYDPNPEFGFNG